MTYFNNRDRSRKHCLTRVVRVHRDEPGREHGWINHGVTIHTRRVCPELVAARFRDPSTRERWRRAARIFPFHSHDPNLS